MDDGWMMDGMLVFGDVYILIKMNLVRNSWGKGERYIYLQKTIKSNHPRDSEPY